jgi:putative MATE family efflux protein
MSPPDGGSTPDPIKVAPGSTATLSPVAQAILTAPIVPTLARLAWPTVIVLVIQTSVGVVETYFLGRLGTAALAGAALVFPVLMLMQTMSNGGIGGGVSSAVARALGAGRRDDADALAYHALVLAIAFGAVFSLAVIGGGTWLYSMLGGRGDALAAALLYSNLVFIGAIPLWITALMASVLRGAGIVKFPATVTLSGGVVLVPLSAGLIFGWGPLPRLEIAGAGVAILVYYVASSIALLAYLRSGAKVVRLRRMPLEWRLFKAILGVGALSAFGTVQTNLTVALVTASVGLLGVEAIAGYGAAVRLDYFLIPMLFGIGAATITMVATNIGAGQIARARHIAWISAALGIGITETIGLAAAAFPQVWIGLFSDDPTILATGSLYLRFVGPTYGLFGLGLMLYFASQGAGRVFWPVMAGSLRLVVAGFGAWVAASMFGVGEQTVFAIVASATIVYGLMSLIAVKCTSWGVRPPRR